MPDQDRRDLVHQFLRFVIGSGLGLLADLGVFATATWSGVAPGLANLLSAGCAVLVVYFFVTKYAFRGGRSRRSFIAFVAWYVVSIAVFSALIEVVHVQFGWAPLVCKLASLPPSFAANFLASRLLLQRPRDGDVDGGVTPTQEHEAGGGGHG